MNKAAQLSKQLEKLDVAEGMQLIEQSNKEALYFDVIGDSMCIMHDDGSVNIIENMGIGCRSMISLQTVDLEFAGLGSNWPGVMKGLLKKT